MHLATLGMKLAHYSAYRVAPSVFGVSLKMRVSLGHPCAQAVHHLASQLVEPAAKVRFTGSRAGASMATVCLGSLEGLAHFYE